MAWGYSKGMTDTRVEDFMSQLSAALPKLSAEKLAEVTAIVDDLLNDADPIDTLEVVGAHIVVETREIGGLFVGLDVAGNAVTACFGDQAVYAESRLEYEG